MPVCYNRLPDRFEDGRHRAIVRGVRAAGFEVSKADPTDPQPGDILVSWNTYGNNEQAGQRVRDAGGIHIVAEEAYIRRIHHEKYYALGVNGHNGNNQNRVGSHFRWRNWGIDLAPWHFGGEHILVCGQRGFGYNAMAMPDDWQDRVLPQLRHVTKRPIWFRPHPKRRRRMPTVRYDRTVDYEQPIQDHLENCWAVVVYTSNAATDALLAGVPAFYCGPNLITSAAVKHGLMEIENPLRDQAQRYKAMCRIAWSQFSAQEIQGGWPIEHLVESATANA